MGRYIPSLQAFNTTAVRAESCSSDRPALSVLSGLCDTLMPPCVLLDWIWGFFFLDAGLLCVHQSGTEPYINWQIGSRQPRDSLWCTHCCGCAVTCASLSVVHTQGQLSLVCTNSLSTNTSLTDPLFSKRSFSKAPRCCARIRLDECSPTVSLYESSQFYFRGPKSQAHRLGGQSVTTVLRPSDA